MMSLRGKELIVEHHPRLTSFIIKSKIGSFVEEAKAAKG